MTRRHRAAHRFIWVVLTPLMLAALYFGLMARIDTPVSDEDSVVRAGGVQERQGGGDAP